MKHCRGFILIYVIVVLCLIGIFMGLLAAGTQSLILQTNRAQLSAIERNLQLSALAWARQQSQTMEEISLDVTKLTTRPAYLTISLGSVEDQRRGVSVTTQCSFGRQSHHTAISVQISGP